MANKDKYVGLNLQYGRQVRGPEGKTFTERYSYSVRDNLKFNQLLLIDGEQKVDEILWKYNRGANITGIDKFPDLDWYDKPDNLEALTQRYLQGECVVMPCTNNVVTFATYMADGRLQLQQRGFVSPAGKPIGNPGKLSVNGGLMESDDMHVEVQREIQEELGVDAEGVYVGVVYDADNGRCNYVFRLNGYDALLKQMAFVDDAVDALTAVEGIGRAFVWREDLEAAIEKGMVTGISVAILRKFPELMPPARPQAA